jgi:hypothetical protein
LRHIVSEVSAQIALDTPSPTVTSPQPAGGVVWRRVDQYRRR